MDPSSTHSSSGRNVRQKRAHSSSSNIQADESLSRSPQPSMQQQTSSSSSSTSASTVSRLQATHKHIAKPKTSRPLSKDSPASLRVEPRENDATVQKNNEVGCLHFREDQKHLQPAQVVEGLKADLGNVRSTLQCKICTRLLFEPYTTSCGHTYCYSCLCTWFLSTTGRKTCPDCRAVILHSPAPAYIIKDLVAVFMSRSDLFPPNETAETLEKARQEEADIVQKDKDNKDARKGGLFRGVFLIRRALHPRPIRDPEDGVDRCPFCHWELEDGACNHCDQGYSEAEIGQWGNSFTTFSEVDETSEFSGRSEDQEGVDIDMDHHLHAAEFLGAADIAEWVDAEDDYYDWDGQRSPNLIPTIPVLRPYFSPRRRAAHSAAAGRRRYTPSITSSRYSDETEMMPVEEEDEEEDGTGEDSSMSGFVVDDDESEESSQRSRSTASETPQPVTSQHRRGGRRVIDSEVSSVASSSVRGGNELEEDDEHDDSDDDGPVPSGRRQRTGAPLASRQAPQSRRAPSSSIGSIRDDTEEGDVDDAIENQGWSPLQHGHDGAEEDEEDSDGASTTVGWEPVTISNERTRNGGSLTPTADRPYVPASLSQGTGRSRFRDGSRGLRRRSSVLSTSTVNYEDGEADDDDSEMDQPQGPTNSHIRSIPPPLVAIGSTLRPVASIRNILPRQPSTATLGTVDSDDSSDASARLAFRRGRRFRHPDYNPIISTIFAEHQYNMRAMDPEQPLDFDQLDDPRSATPVARPRTANRNRRSSRMDLAGQAMGNGVAPVAESSPQMARVRTPAGLNASNSRIPRNPSRNERRRPQPDLAYQGSLVNNGVPLTANAVEQTFTGPARGGPVLEPSIDDDLDGLVDEPTQRPFLPSVHDALARPPSVMGFRAPTANRWAQTVDRGPQVPSGFPGLNVAARTFQGPNRNPFMALYARPRPSTQRLREQPSTATIRARPSQRGLRGQQSPTSTRDSVPQNPRPQTSRLNLRAQPSRQRLQTQPSVRALRNDNVPLQAALRQQIENGLSQPASRSPSVMTAEERERRAAELVQSRAQQLRANPFTARRLNQPAVSQAAVEDNSVTADPSVPRANVENEQTQSNISRQPNNTERRPWNTGNGSQTPTARNGFTAASGLLPGTNPGTTPAPQPAHPGVSQGYSTAGLGGRGGPSTRVTPTSANPVASAPIVTQSAHQPNRRTEIRPSATSAQAAPVRQISTRTPSVRNHLNTVGPSSGNAIDNASTVRA
ncbi:hypothetical protein NA57DRAFT_75747 [Rhizodiscina lignyota]|uniref:RING-type domain-containing protein n=1 Tax=Rhizodiscina lignyota TaxID=1504668 RepID=A0A9P4IHW6_9PEZI|nr:hypothetical protein NA57DRAFT_75747 [Rhizodiscina lignyota]